jgi:uncharacterized membrane protein
MSALLGDVPLIVCVGYVLIREQSKTLKFHAIRSVVFVGVLAIISAIITSGDGLFSILNTFLSFTGTTFRFAYPLGLGSIVIYAVRIVRSLGLIYMAFLAYSGKDIEIKLFKKYFSDDSMGIE